MLAAGSGRVVARYGPRAIVADELLPDQTPLAKPGVLPLDEVPGNHVVIRMRTGLSGVLAHFVPGTVAVRLGSA